MSAEERDDDEMVEGIDYFIATEHDVTLTLAECNRRVAAARAQALREAAEEMWRVFLRLPHTPSPIGDYVQRQMLAWRAEADRIEAQP